MQETMDVLAGRFKKNEFYQIVFSVGKRVSKNELQNLLKVKRFLRIIFESKTGRTELRPAGTAAVPIWLTRENHDSMDL